MDFSFAPELADFRREVGAFARRELAPHYQSDDRAARMRAELPAQLAGMGLTGLRVPTALGGLSSSACRTIGGASGWSPTSSRPPTA